MTKRNDDIETEDEEEQQQEKEEIKRKRNHTTNHAYVHKKRMTDQVMHIIDEMLKKHTI